MTGRPWYPFYPDAYERDAGSLSYVQDSAYRRMLDHYYKSGEPLSLDKECVYRACRAMRREERAAIDFCLSKFFVEGDDGWHQTRADEEIIKAAEISAKRADAANKRHSKQPNKTCPIDDAIAEQLDTHTTATTTGTKKKKDMPAGAGLDGFEEFWKSYKAPPNSKKPDARKAWLSTARTRPPLPDLLRAVAGYSAWLAEEWRKNKREFPAKQHPSSFLRGEVWNGYLNSTSDAPAYDFGEVERLEAEHRAQKAAENGNVH
jgi:uncharacterized protein YdaU (DUF1376 family)